MRLEKRDGAVSRRVLTALLVDDTVCGRIASVWQDDAFPDRWSNTVAKMAVDYFKKYDCAPGKNVEGLVAAWATTADKDSVKAVEAYLTSLNGEYTKLKKNVNPDFVTDQATELFEKTRLEKLADQIKGDVAAGDLARAKRRMEQSKPIDVSSDAPVDVLGDFQALKSAFKSKATPLFTMPQALDPFFGKHLCRDGFIAMMGPEKVGKCVAGDTEVVLADGSVRTIADVVRGRDDGVEVLSLDEETGRVVPARPTQFWDNGVKECFAVTTRTGRRVVTTGNHKYLTPDGWKELKDVRPGDYIAVPKRIPVFGTERMPEAEVKFLAYMLAEGCTVASQPNFTNADPSLVADFHAACDQLGIGYRRKGITTHLRGAGPLVRKLGMWGCKATDKIVPPELFRCPKDQIATFLRVFFSCDGGLVKKHGVCVNMDLGNKRLLKQIGHLLTRFGIVHRISFRPKTCGGKRFKAWRLEINSAEAVYRFLSDVNMLSYKRTEPVRPTVYKSFLDKLPWKVADRMLKELAATVPDPVKTGTVKPGGYVRRGEGVRRLVGPGRYRAIREQIAKKCPIMRQSFSAAFGHPVVDKYLNADLLWDEVVRVKAVGNKHTYDLGVPDLHNFVANDCVVHNTFWLQEFGWQAMLQGRNVAWFACGDMSRDQMLMRMAVRASRTPTDDVPYLYPKGIEPSGGADRTTADLEQRQAPNPLDFKTAKAKMQALGVKLGATDRLKLAAYPNDTVTVPQLDATLKRWEVNHGWTADVCIASGQMVLTDRGPVPIESVKGGDKLWDGETWVSHAGLVYKGVKDVITHAGLTATPDHLVWTTEGWRTLIQSRQLGLPISKTGHQGEAVRIGQSFVIDRPGEGVRLLQEGQVVHREAGVRSGPVCPVCGRKVGAVGQPVPGGSERVSVVFTTETLSDLALAEVGRGASEMSKPQRRQVRRLRWEGDRVSLPFGVGSVFVGVGDVRASRPEARNRPGRQRRALRAGKHSAFHPQTEHATHQKGTENGQGFQVSHTVPACHLCGQYAESLVVQNDPERGFGPLEVNQTPVRKAHVWDLRNAGPLHRFTVQGVLAHNCIIDYADILAPINGQADTRDQINATWKRLRALSQSRHCLVITATQVKAGGYKKGLLDKTDFADDKRKFAHVTGMVAINQQEEDREQQIQRLNWVVLREGEFRASRCVFVAGCLALANPCVHSTF